jgi:hypothetical protein
MPCHGSKYSSVLVMIDIGEEKVVCEQITFTYIRTSQGKVRNASKHENENNQRVDLNLCRKLGRVEGIEF